MLPPAAVRPKRAPRLCVSHNADKPRTAQPISRTICQRGTGIRRLTTTAPTRPGSHKTRKPAQLLQESFADVLAGVLLGPMGAKGFGILCQLAIARQLDAFLIDALHRQSNRAGQYHREQTVLLARRDSQLLYH